MIDDLVGRGSEIFAFPFSVFVYFFFISQSTAQLSTNL